MLGDFGGVSFWHGYGLFGPAPQVSSCGLMPGTLHQSSFDILDTEGDSNLG